MEPVLGKRRRRSSRRQLVIPSREKWVVGILVLGQENVVVLELLEAPVQRPQERDRRRGIANDGVVRAGSPKELGSAAARSALTTTASASMVSPLAVRTPVARPSSTRTSSTAVPVRISTPFAVAASTSN